MHVGLLVVERDTREVCLEIKAEELQANLPIWSPVTIIAPSSADRDKIYLKVKESERERRWNWAPDNLWHFFYNSAVSLKNLFLKIRAGSPVWSINKTIQGTQQTSYGFWRKLPLFKSGSSLEERCVLAVFHPATFQQTACLWNSAKWPDLAKCCNFLPLFCTHLYCRSTCFPFGLS